MPQRTWSVSHETKNTRVYLLVTCGSGVSAVLDAMFFFWAFYVDLLRPGKMKTRAFELLTGTERNSDKIVKIGLLLVKKQLVFETELRLPRRSLWSM